MTARLFDLVRTVDPSGISGTGTVAEGCRFTDGTVAMRWLTETPSTTLYDGGIRAVEAIHGHGGSTWVRWHRPSAPAGGQRHTPWSDDAALDDATSLPDAFRRSGVIPLPDDAGTAWERHDDPEADR